MRTVRSLKYSAIKTYYDIYVWYAKQMEHLTKYFPFSLIGQDMTFHYQNRDTRVLMQEIVYVAEGIGLEFMVEASQKDEYFYHINGYYSKNGRKRINNRAMLKELEKRLKLAQGGLYIRKLPNDRVQFLIPREVGNNFI